MNDHAAVKIDINLKKKERKLKNRNKIVFTSIKSYY